MKRLSFYKLDHHGPEFFLLPTFGFKVLNGFMDRKIYLCAGWLCFGVSVLLKRIQEDTDI